MAPPNLHSLWKESKGLGKQSTLVRATGAAEPQGAATTGLMDHLQPGLTQVLARAYPGSRLPCVASWKEIVGADFFIWRM